MDCRETQALLNAFHDGELREDDRTRVDNHLRGCTDCGRLLADLARADEAAGVPDPGPGYWDRFNSRVADRIEREAEGPKAAVLRPNQGWMRQQLRFLVPAVAAAALVVVVVRYGGQDTVAPTPAQPPSVSVTEKPATADPEGQRMAKGEIGSPATGKTVDPAVSLRAPEESKRAAVAKAAPPRIISKERLSTVGREDRDRLADERPPEAQAEGKKMAAAAPPALMPQVAAKGEPESGTGIKRDPHRAETSPSMSVGNARTKPGPPALSSDSPAGASPCETARRLSAKERFREAEAAQRECLARDLSPPAQETGLVFLAELLDRQARFAEADAVLADVHRQYPKSVTLDLYRQQRPMVQKQQAPGPAPR